MGSLCRNSEVVLLNLEVTMNASTLEGIHPNIGRLFAPPWLIRGCEGFSGDLHVGLLRRIDSTTMFIPVPPQGTIILVLPPCIIICHCCFLAGIFVEDAQHALKVFIPLTPVYYEYAR